MPQNLTEGLYTGESLVSAPLGAMSYEKITVANGQKLGANRVLGQITATGKYVAVNPAAADGSQTAKRILRAAADATAGDVAAIAFANWVEVNASELDWGTLNAGQIATAKAQLQAATIFVREAV